MNDADRIVRAMYACLFLWACGTNNVSVAVFAAGLWVGSHFTK